MKEKRPQNRDEHKGLAQADLNDKERGGGEEGEGGEQVGGREEEEGTPRLDSLLLLGPIIPQFYTANIRGCPVSRD